MHKNQTFSLPDILADLGDFIHTKYSEPLWLGNIDAGVRLLLQQFYNTIPQNRPNYVGESR